MARSGDNARGAARLHQHELPHTKSKIWKEKFQGALTTKDILSPTPSPAASALIQEMMMTYERLECLTKPAGEEHNWDDSYGTGIDEDEEQPTSRTLAARPPAQTAVPLFNLGDRVLLCTGPRARTLGSIVDVWHEWLYDRPRSYYAEVAFEGAPSRWERTVNLKPAGDAPTSLRRSVRQKLSPEEARVARIKERREAEAKENAEATANIEAVLDASAEKWRLLPDGRVMPRRLREVVDALIERGPAAGDYATLEDVLACEATDGEVEHGERGKDSRVSVAVKRVPLGEAQALGAPFAMRSVLLEVDVPEEVVRAAMATIPKELVPQERDTVVDLIGRIGKCGFLDSINVMNPEFPEPWSQQGLTNLNSCPISMQPKRCSQSVVVKAKAKYNGRDGEGRGRWIWRLFNYTSCQRYEDDWRGRPMLWPTFVLGLTLWVLAWPWLTPLSRRSPPTHCQLLFYYWLLRAKMGQHRDNSSSSDVKRFAKGGGLSGNGHASGGAMNSQKVGTNVLVFSTGTAPMTFTLAMPPRGDVLADRKEYVVKPSFQMCCGAFTLSVLDPVDDEILTHGARYDGEFEVARIDGSPAWWRLGWTYRWLQAEEDFYDDTGGLRLSAARVAKLEGKPRSDKVFPRGV